MPSKCFTIMCRLRAGLENRDGEVYEVEWLESDEQVKPREIEDQEE